MAFQVVNRTLWTIKKVYKSRLRAAQIVKDVGKLKQWNICSVNVCTILRVRLCKVIIQHLNSVSPEHIPRVEISQLNVIYNVPHPSLLLIFMTNPPEMRLSSSHKKSIATSSTDVWICLQWQGRWPVHKGWQCILIQLCAEFTPTFNRLVWKCLEKQFQRF